MILNSGNANAATGEAGRAAAERMCRLTAAGLGCRPEQVLVCSTGLIGIPLPDRHGQRRHPRAARATAAPDGGRRAAEAILTTDTHAKQVRGRRATASGRRDGQGGGHAGPQHGTMLAVPHHRRRRPSPRPCAGPCAQRGGPVVQPADDRRRHLDQRHRHRAGQRPLRRRPRRGRADRGAVGGVRRPGRADGRRRRGGDQGRPGPGDRRGRRAEDAAAGRPQGGREPAGQVLVLRRGPLLGPDRVASWARPASPSTWTGPASATAASRCAGRGRGRRLRPRSRWPRSWPSPTIELVADLGLGDGEATVLTVDLTHGYIDENMGTS